jgi:hypothetical protein
MRTLHLHPRPFGTLNVYESESLMQEYLHIRPGQGLGSIRLGMRPDEIIRVFDEPQMYEEWMGGNLNHSLLFQGLILGFSAWNSSAPLPESKLVSVTIFQRRGACLFERFISDWNKTSLMEELKARRFELQTPSNGDIIVPNQLSLSFDEQERLIWVEIP